MEDYNKGKELYSQWACEVIRKGGTISAEHGVGKLKTVLLAEMYGKGGMEQMRAVKRLFDPDNILNRGNMFKISPEIRWLSPASHSAAELFR